MKKISNNFVFNKKNFQIMIVGIVFIIIGFLLMTGKDANTRPDGTFDPNFWNENIFSIMRIRIAPTLIIIGFIIQIIAIFFNNKNKIND